MIDRSKWKLVRLGDVVRHIKDTVDIDECGLTHYLGGEHFNSDALHVNGKGAIEGSTIGPAFIMRFKPGHVLLVSRNPHLRKCAVAEFEGICSNVTYVCQSKNEGVLRQHFLPFIMKTEAFWNFAQSNKRGSTNFYLNWSDFAQYEFLLPPIEEQERIAEVLWAADEVIQKYEGSYEKIKLVFSLFLDNYFENKVKTKACVPFANVGRWISGGTPARCNKDYWNGDIPWISPKDMKTETISVGIENVTSVAVKNSRLRELPVNSILFVVRGMILAHTFPIAITTEKVTINQDMKGIIVSDSYHPEYIFYWLKQKSKSILNLTEESSHGTKRLSTNILGSLQIPKVSLRNQKLAINRFKTIDESIAEMQNTTAKARKTLLFLTNSFLGGAN